MLPAALNAAVAARSAASPAAAASPVTGIELTRIVSAKSVSASNTFVAAYTCDSPISK